MRCGCCNRVLSDFEATRRSATTGEHLDICNKCIKGLGIKTIDREDLIENQRQELDDFYEEYAADDVVNEEFLGLPLKQKPQDWDE